MTDDAAADGPADDLEMFFCPCSARSLPPGRQWLCCSGYLRQAVPPTAGPRQHHGPIRSCRPQPLPLKLKQQASMRSMMAQPPGRIVISSMAMLILEPQSRRVDRHRPNPLIPAPFPPTFLPHRVRSGIQAPGPLTYKLQTRSAASPLLAVDILYRRTYDYMFMLRVIRCSCNFDMQPSQAPDGLV